MKTMYAIVSMRPKCLLALLLILGLWSNSSDLRAAEESPTLKLPAAPVNWINSPPLSAEMLRGKAALFYLYEEG